MWLGGWRPLKFLCKFTMRRAVLGASPLRPSRWAERPAPRTPSGGRTSTPFFMVDVFFCCLRFDFVFFFSLRLPWPLGFVSLCYVSFVHQAVGRGFFASLAGSFWSRVSAVVVPCGSIFAPFLSMFGVFLSTFGLFLSLYRWLFSCIFQDFFVPLQYK